MPAATIATGLCSSAAAGILAALLLLPFAELRRFFFALNAGLALAFLAIAQPLRGTSGGPGSGAGPGASAAAAVALVALALSVVYIASLYLPQAGHHRGVLMVAAAAAALVTGLDGWTTAPPGQPGWLFAATALAAAALLGAVIVGTILGHWYLVRSRLSERHLVRFARLLGGTVGARAVLLVAALLVAGSTSPVGLERFLHGLMVDRGLFFWSRVFFGLLGPAVFAWMVHETARIRSTQSATGILYIGVIFVLMGELLARFLSVAGAVPV